MLRFDDAERTLALSVRDVVGAGMPRGHLTLDVVRRSRAALVAGQWVHQQYQSAREREDAGFRREVRLEWKRVVAGWTVTLQGRVDGLVDARGQWIVEEVKSTALDGMRLAASDLDDWPDYREQAEIYVWMLGCSKPGERVTGRLILVSLADGSRRGLDVFVEPEEIEELVMSRLEEFIAVRERRLAWMHERRTTPFHWPFPERRAGQETVEEAVEDALSTGRPCLVQAPTGLGKTAAVLSAAVKVAVREGKQVFWATSRTTQQPVVEATLARLADAGTRLRSVTLNARTKVCLNETDDGVQVVCRPEMCRFANKYFDKIREGALLDRYSRSQSTRTTLAEAGLEHEVCPYQLARDVTGSVDVVIGDANYVFDPGSRLREFFETGPDAWIVVVDEVHQLVERARGWRSPRITAAQAQKATSFLEGLGSEYTTFAFLARQIEDTIVEAQHQVVGPTKGYEGVAELSDTTWDDLADRVEEVGLDYALLITGRTDIEEDPWLDLARSVLRFQSVLGEVDEDTVAVVNARPGQESVRLVCLDPSEWMGKSIQRLGGFAGCSATLSPTRFYSDLLGLGARLVAVDVPSPFPRENLQVLLAPRVSTAFKDRLAHAPATAELLADCIAAVPGNVAVYFPSFAMLTDIARRWTIEGREVLVQPRNLSESDRSAWLDRLGAQGRAPVVLAAVLGGIFAEGVDLPSGALSAVMVCGPAFPPVGLERDLLRGFYEERYDAGFLYASVVPGMTRVVQAAGRLIRRPEDRGAVVLVGGRFRWRDVGGLLPERWEPEAVPSVPDALSAFFAEGD